VTFVFLMFEHDVHTKRKGITKSRIQRFMNGTLPKGGRKAAGGIIAVTTLLNSMKLWGRF
jgi:hypothetical protein